MIRFAVSPRTAHRARSMPSRSRRFRPRCASRASATMPMKMRISVCRGMGVLHNDSVAAHPKTHPARDQSALPELVAFAYGSAAGRHRHGDEFMGPVDPWSHRAQVRRNRRQLCRRGAGSPGPQDARTDRWRSQQTHCRGRLELGVLRRTQSCAASRRARVHARSIGIAAVARLGK